jgi:hypothetical protein
VKLGKQFSNIRFLRTYAFRQETLSTDCFFYRKAKFAMEDAMMKLLLVLIALTSFVPATAVAQCNPAVQQCR